MPEWVKVVVGLKILQIIDRVDEEKWEKLKEEEHERLLDS